MRKFSVVFLILVVIIFGLSSNIFSDEYKFGKIPEGDWQVGPPDDYPEADAIVLIDWCNLTVTTENINSEHLVRIKIITEAGIEEVGDIEVRYHKKYDKLKGFKAHTLTPDGKKHKVEKNAIFTKETGSYKTKTFSFPALEVGSIIEYKYRIVSNRFHYLEPWYFQGSSYTMSSQFSVSLSNGFNYNVAYQNVPPQQRKPVQDEKIDIGASNTRTAKIVSFAWEMKNLPPIKSEPYMSCENNYRSSLRFQLLTYQDQYNYITFSSSWGELGELQEKDFEDYCNKRKDVKKLAEETTVGLTTNKEKSQAIYDYVVSTVKTSNEYDSYYFVHEKMEGLLSEKHGSGEGKNLLLVEMHKALEIPAWPVMISSRDNGKLCPENPDLRQFDYIIAFVQFDDGFEFLDASSKYAPYGLLPSEYLAGGGLLIDGKNSELVRVTSKPINSGRIDLTKIVVDTDGSAICSSQCLFTGYYASDYAEIFESNTPEDFVNNRFIDRLDFESTLGDYKCELDSIDRFNVELDFSSDELVKALDNNLIITPVTYAYRNNPFKSKKRFFPVDFSYPFTYMNQVQITYPDSIKEYFLPENLSHQITGASYLRESSITGHTLIVSSKLQIDEPEYAPQFYKDIRDFFDKIAQATRDNVTIVLKEE